MTKEKFDRTPNNFMFRKMQIDTDPEITENSESSFYGNRYHDIRKHKKMMILISIGIIVAVIILLIVCLIIIYHHAS